MCFHQHILHGRLKHVIDRIIFSHPLFWLESDLVEIRFVNHICGCDCQLFKGQFTILVVSFIYGLFHIVEMIILRRVEPSFNRVELSDEFNKIWTDNYFSPLINLRKK